MKKLLTFLTLLTLFFMTGWAETVTLDLKNGKLGTSNFSPQSGSAQQPSATNGDITVAFGGNNTINTNTSNAYIGWNNNTSLTVTHSTYNITKVVLKYQTQNTRGTITASTDTLNHDATTMTWNVGSTSTKTVTITRNSSGNQIRLTSIEITFDGGGSTPTTFTLTLPTGLTGGSVSATGYSDLAAIPSGTSMTVTAIPNTGYTLEWMKANGVNVETPFTFAIAENTTITAAFKEETVTPSGDYLFYESWSNTTGTGGNDGSWSGSIASGAVVSDQTGWTYENQSGGENVKSEQTVEVKFRLE